MSITEIKSEYYIPNEDYITQNPDIADVSDVCDVCDDEDKLYRFMMGLFM